MKSDNKNPLKQRLHVKNRNIQYMTDPCISEGLLLNVKKLWGQRNLFARVEKTNLNLFCSLTQISCTSSGCRKGVKHLHSHQRLKLALRAVTFIFSQKPAERLWTDSSDAFRYAFSSAGLNFQSVSGCSWTECFCWREEIREVIPSENRKPHWEHVTAVSLLQLLWFLRPAHDSCASGGRFGPCCFWFGFLMDLKFQTSLPVKDELISDFVHVFCASLGFLFGWFIFLFVYIGDTIFMFETPVRLQDFRMQDTLSVSRVVTEMN